METWIIWIIIAILLIGIEVLSQMVMTLCLAVGCIFGMAASLCGLSLAWQISIAGIVAIVAYFALAPWLKRWQQKARDKNRHLARTGMDALLGRRATVTEEIKPGETGRVRIDGDNWQAVAPRANETVKRGETVVVDAYDSIILTVSTIPTN